MNLTRSHTAEFLEAVKMIQSRGVTRDQAWNIAAGVFPQLHHQVVLANSLPEGAQLSDDGKSIIPDWPVTPDTLRKLGLPADASKQEYELYHRAEAVTHASWCQERVKAQTPEESLAKFADVINEYGLHNPPTA